MRRILYSCGALAAAALLVLSGCDPVAVDGEGTVTFTGTVLNAQTDRPVPRAFVRVADVFPEVVTEADSLGRFTLEVEIDSTTDVSLTAFKDGFTSETQEVLAVAGRQITVPPFRIVPTSAQPGGSGEASSIILVEQSAPSLGVQESGAASVGEIVFQVVDSLGRPIDLDHAVDVRFSFGARPGGGEFLSPAVVGTDDEGRAVVTLTSGTMAGTVQVLAEATAGSKQIRSLPVAITIHGGLPDPSHFSIAPNQLNFPGYNIYGLTNTIAAFVGDKYGNPVRPGTAVYFTATGGIIQGSTQTDDLGRGSAALTSAAPQPFHPTLGAGYAVVTARTGDEAQQTIETDALVLFSGRTQVDITPRTLAIGQRYNYTVSDQNGNALAEGTSIQVAVEGSQVKAVGDTDVTLDDTLAKGEGITEFSFRVVVSSDSTAQDPPSLESIAITVTSPNGNVRARLLSTGQMATEQAW